METVVFVLEDTPHVTRPTSSLLCSLPWVLWVYNFKMWTMTHYENPGQEHVHGRASLGVGGRALCLLLGIGNPESGTNPHVVVLEFARMAILRSLYFK